MRASPISPFVLLMGLVLAPGAVSAQKAPGSVLTQQKVSDTAGGFTGTLDDFNLFGAAVTSVGTLDADGVADLIVGSPFDDDGLGVFRGALFVLFMNANGTVKAHQEISTTAGGFGGTLDDSNGFGISAATLGDLDADGRTDVAVGAFLDDDGGSSRGAVWVLDLDADGTVDSQQKISDTAGGFTGTLDAGDLFGRSVAALGDLDGDGVEDLAVGAQQDDDGGTDRGAVWILFLDTDGTVKSHQKISSTTGSFGGSLDDDDGFGIALAPLGDLDGDTVVDLAVGALGDDDGGPVRGAVWILFLDTDGTVKSEQKISSTAGGFAGTLDDLDEFGSGLAAISDLDGDGVVELAVGAPTDDDATGPPFAEQGAAWILFLETDGTVKTHQKISATEGGFTGVLDQGDRLGGAVASPGDLDGDGFADLVVGSNQDDDGGDDHGAVYVLNLRGTAAVSASATFRNGTGVNPAGFANVSLPIIGTPWQSTIDIVTPGALASIVVIGLGGAINGPNLAFGQLLTLPPFLPFDVGPGAHAIPMPFDVSLVGLPFATQGATFSSGNLILNNAIDLVIGTF